MEFQKRVKIRIGPFSKKKKYSTLIENRDLILDVKFYVNQLGGNQALFHQFRNDLPGNCSSKKNNGECLGVVEKLFDYSANLEQQKSQGVLNYNLQNYADIFPELKIPALALSFDTEKKILSLKQKLHSILEGETYAENDEIVKLKNQIISCYFNQEC